jgi:hypothetical protein
MTKTEPRYSALVDALRERLVFDGLFVVKDAADVYAQIEGSKWSVAEIKRAAVNQAACEWLASR